MQTFLRESVAREQVGGEEGILMGPCEPRFGQVSDTDAAEAEPQWLGPCFQKLLLHMATVVCFYTGHVMKTHVKDTSRG